MPQDFTNAIPPPLIAQNPNVQQLAALLDNLKDFKDQSGVLLFQNLLNMWTMKDPNFVRAFLFELGQLPILTDQPVYLQERVILNSFAMMDQKGTLDGLNIFVNSYLDGSVTGDFSNWFPAAMLVPDDYVYGYLPDGNDLGVAVNDPTDYTFLFDGSFSLYYGTVILTIRSDVAGTSAAMRRDFMLLLPNFLAMAYPGSTNISVNFELLNGTFVETLNY